MSQLASVEAIFFAALEKPSPEERAAYLDGACGGDAELRRCVERMLNAQPKVGSFMEKPAADLAAAVTAPPGDPPPLREGPGTRIGAYKLLQQIGEGGMGVVYMAEQTEPVRRLVALKILKSGLEGAQAVARFESERQALALMDHPNIAKVFDAGTTAEGRPYFVMELVKGVPITKYCDERRLTPRERLGLFVPVCQAVQHAHQKGIIHRDLKPSNVLIALYDGTPVPKVIDFGVAKATGQKLTERTLFTAFGAVVGTPEYMSPEQAELNQIDIDTRSDIYSLGVLLYELLTGSTPLGRQRLDEGAILEVLRLIREEEPPKPSTRLSTSETLASVAANRNTEPKKLTKLVRGELDWIVMKTLEKDRNLRYETASGLAMDVLRYLNDEPVVAGPPGVGYRLQKYLKRHPLILGFGILFVLLGVAFLFGAAMGGISSLRSSIDSNDRANKEVFRSVLADGETYEARQVQKFFEEKVIGGDAHKEKGGEVTLRQALAAAEPHIAPTFAGGPITEASVHDEFGRIYLRLREPALAVRQFERSLELRRKHTILSNEKHLDHLDGDLRRRYRRHDDALVDTMHNLAEALEAQGQPDKAAPLWREALDKVRSRDPADPDALALMGYKLLGQKRAAEAEPWLRECLRIREQLASDEWGTFNARSILGGSLLSQKKYAEAEPLLVAGYEGMKQHVATIAPQSPRHDNLPEAAQRLVQLYEAWGRPEQAAAWRKKRDASNGR
jgi:serine/threonine protein kinase/tetratricopeptide (TPR) repeat protein